ncbi:MAG: sigma factor [Gemmatimonadota bacterium]
MRPYLLRHPRPGRTITSRFPDTRISVLEALRRPDPDQRRHAAELLIRAYRAPILATLAWRWNLQPADAEDLTQGFFAAALEKEWFERFDPARGRFRTFVRVAADRFAANAAQSAGRLKRGGDSVTISLDDLQDLVPRADEEIEERFRAEWVRSIFELALNALREEAGARQRQTQLQLFEAYDLLDDERPTYAALGEQFGLNPSEVINHLAWARRRFRTHVLDVIRQLAGSEAEYREDVRDLLGIEAP